jgi:hypothetical protein
MVSVKDGGRGSMGKIYGLLSVVRAPRILRRLTCRGTENNIR